MGLISRVSSRTYRNFFFVKNHHQREQDCCSCWYRHQRHPCPTSPKNETCCSSCHRNRTQNAFWKLVEKSSPLINSPNKHHLVKTLNFSKDHVTQDLLCFTVVLQ